MWDERYARPEYVYGTSPNDFLVEQADRLAPGTRVLSLGEGEGRNAAFLAGRGMSVVAIDSSSVGLEKARALAKKQGKDIVTICADLASAEFRPDLGAVVNVFCHLPSVLRRAVHRRAVAALAPGGIVIVELYRPEQLRFGTGGPKDEDLLATLAGLREDFEGCEELVGREVERDVVEGTFHTGRAAVVQLVARRC